MARRTSRDVAHDTNYLPPHLAPDQRWSTISHATARLKTTFRQAKALGQVVDQSHGTLSTLPQTCPARQKAITYTNLH